MKTSVNRSGAGVHRKVKKYDANLSSRLKAIKAESSEVATSAKLKSRVETSDGGVGKSFRSGSGLGNAGDSRSFYFCWLRILLVPNFLLFFIDF